jgi:hypothetical protein
LHEWLTVPALTDADFPRAGGNISMPVTEIGSAAVAPRKNCANRRAQKEKGRDRY